MVKNKIKKLKKSKLFPEGIKFKYILAKLNTGINFRYTISNYRKQVIVRHKIFRYFYKNLIVGNNHIRDIRNKNIAFFKKINCYRGIRHKIGLPVRGQRTKTNAKTSKKKKPVYNIKKVRNNNVKKK